MNNTHVMLTPGLDLNTRSFLCSNVSPANCGSSLTVIVYRSTIIVITAIDSVSENRRPRHAHGPALNGMNASRGQLGSRNRLELKAWGSFRYRAVQTTHRM